MAEWSKAAVSKTVNGVTRSGVRIPFSPPFFLPVAKIIRHEQKLTDPFSMSFQPGRTIPLFESMICPVFPRTETSKPPANPLLS